MVLDEHGRILHANRAAQVLLATLPANRHLGRLLQPASGCSIELLVRSAAQTGHARATCRLRKRPAEPGSYELHLVSHFERVPRLLLAWLLDRRPVDAMATRLRLSEMNLAESQRLTHTGSWILDFISGETDWSAETCRIFGFDEPPPLPPYSAFLARVAPEDQEHVHGGLRDCFESGEPRPLHYRMLLPDGSIKHIETVAQRLPDGHPLARRLMGTVMDVTERVIAAERLKASERVARGQLDALTRTIDAVARESSPDQVIEQVLRTLTETLDGEGVSVWLRNDVNATAELRWVFQGDRLRTDEQSGHPASGARVPLVQHPIWRPVLTTGQHVMCSDLHGSLDFPYRDYLLSQGVHALLALPLWLGNEVTGLLALRFSRRRELRDDEIALANALTQQVTLAMQLIRLTEQNRDAAIALERARMARDLHDTLAQGLTGVIVQLEAAADALVRDLGEDAAARIERAAALARAGLSEARRSVHALRPRVLEDSGFLEALGTTLTAMTGGTGIEGAYEVLGAPRPLPAQWECELLFVAREGITNAVRHAQPRRVAVAAHFGASDFRLRVQDDGLGYEPAAARAGFGLLGMRERVTAIGGRLEIASSPAAGTVIKVTVPLPPDDLE